MALAAEARVRAALDQVSSEVGTETVILSLGRGQYYGLNEVGTRVWQLLREPRRIEEIRDAVLSEYDVDLEQCERDILALLERLDAAGLLVADDSPA